MSLENRYDTQNIFARIIRGEMPKVSVFEDDHVLAFMDVFPQSDGHVLVISKEAQSVNLVDLPADDLSRIMATVQKISRAVVAALAPDGFRIVQFNGEAAGQTVFHTHFHIIPVYQGRDLAPHGEGMAPADVLEATAEKIRNAL